MNWISIRNEKPDIGIEVIGYSEDWIDEDYNPEGTNMCFLNEHPETGYWVIAKWCGQHDEYHTRYSHAWWDTENESNEITMGKIMNPPIYWQYKPSKPNIQ
jgi:hypothetical protein